ncbi:hypothetical protein TNCV_1366921 [Trichonephila clavipes]|nr:hypothetical protein TNCV_1366921 [Trichonephila clavipes]
MGGAEGITVSQLRSVRAVILSDSQAPILTIANLCQSPRSLAVTQCGTLLKKSDRKSRVIVLYIQPLNRHQNGNPETLDTLQNFTDARETLLRASTPQNNPTNSLDFKIHLEPLRPTVTYQGSHLRAAQCRPNAAFYKSDQALAATSIALHLSSAIESYKADYI